MFHTLKKILRAPVLFVLMMYFFCLLATPDTAYMLLMGSLPFYSAVTIFVQIPYIIYLNTSPLVFTLFLVNMALTTWYVLLFFERVSQRLIFKNILGLTGPGLSALSLGCLACGAFLSPLFVPSLLGIPATFWGAFSLGIALAANVLLTVGIYMLTQYPLADVAQK